MQRSKTFATNRKDQRGQNCVNSFNGIDCSDNSSHFYTGIEFGWQKTNPPIASDWKFGSDFGQKSIQMVMFAPKMTKLTILILNRVSFDCFL